MYKILIYHYVKTAFKVLIIFSLGFVTVAHANILTFIYGVTPKNSLFYLPYGIHTTVGNSELQSFQLTGGIYRSFYGMTFINSFHDRVWSLGAERYVYQFHQLNLGYGVGIMYGYNGNLAQVEGIPLRHTFLIEHNINPVVVGVADIDILKYLQLKFVFTPLVIAAGLQIDF